MVGCLCEESARTYEVEVLRRALRNAEWRFERWYRCKWREWRSGEVMAADERREQFEALMRREELDDLRPESKWRRR